MGRSTVFFALVSCSAAIAAINGCVSDEATAPVVDGGGDDGGTDSSMASDTSAPPTDAPVADAADAAPWTPAVLPGLALWLSAGDLPAVTNIATWMDRSGNLNNAVAVPGSQPTYLAPANGINNLPAVHFDGVSSYFSVNDAPTLNFGNADFRIAFVARADVVPPTSQPYGLFLEKHLNAPPYDGISLHLLDAGVVVFLGQSANTPYPGTFTDKTPHVFTVYRALTVVGAGGKLGLGIDGIANQTAGTLPVIDVSGAGNALTIGGRKSPDAGLPDSNIKADIAEIVIIKGPTTPADDKTLNAYLKAKYAL